MWWLLAVLVTDSLFPGRVAVAPAETLTVAVTGAGPPVVLVPGLFGSAFGFRRVAPLLAQAGYRAVVIEPLGVGSSSRPPAADYSLTAQADRIGATLDRLGLKSVIVVAHSVGASMALRLAYRRPDLVSAVVSLDGGPAESAATPSFRRALRFAPLLKLFGGRRRVEGAVRQQMIAASADPSWVTDEVVRGYTAGATRNLDATIDALRRMAAGREPERLADHLRDVACPVLLLVGGAPHASGIGIGESELLRRELRAFRADTVAGAGHFLHEEQPAAVVEALQRVPAFAAASH